MIYFNSDYLEGAHPAIMERLLQTNMEQTVGYGEDAYCAAAREKIKAACQAPEADVHFLVGGTLTNTTVIASILRPYQGVLSAASGHINCHETGAIESSGHKVLALPTNNASAGVYVYGSGGATLDRVSLAAGYPLRVNSGNGSTKVSHAHIKGGYRVAYIQNPNQLTIEDSLLESLSGSYEAVGVDAGAAGTTTTAVVSRSTLVSPGSHPLVDVTSYTAGATAKAVLRGVALIGAGAPFGHPQAAGVASVDVDRSAFRTGYAPGPSDVIGTHNLGAPTGFVDAAAGDYRLRFDSPLVDAGGLVLVPADATDLEGGRRAVDGKGDGSTQPDIGAYEYQRRAPAFDASASTGAAPAGTPIAFLMSNVSDPDPGETPTLRWDFSDGSSAPGAAVQIDVDWVAVMRN